MNAKLRYVLDTNVIISALLFNKAVPGQVFFRCLIHGQILLSSELAQELNDVLSRNKFDRYITRDQRERFLEALIQECELVRISERISACRDPADDKILELAVSGAASCIITGDKDLLTLNPFRGISIRSPVEHIRLADSTPEES